MINKVIKFSATWCRPCQVYKPIFEEVTKNEKYQNIIFQEIDVDEDDTELTAKYNIRSVPTTIILNESDEVTKKITGLIAKTDLQSILDDELNG